MVMVPFPMAHGEAVAVVPMVATPMVMVVVAVVPVLGGSRLCRPDADAEAQPGREDGAGQNLCSKSHFHSLRRSAKNEM
jgi:hypothetical protein